MPKYGFWQVARDRRLALDRARLMGVLNVTPDSFSDGGAYASVADAAQAALRMRDEGACIIDVGGESTRPGAQPVEVIEQIRRTVPVIRAIREHVSPDDLLIAIDTTRRDVACAALDAGADIINDTSAGLDDSGMFALAASRGCGLVLMHRRTMPARDSYSHSYSHAPDYGDGVVPYVRAFLNERCDAAIAQGIAAQAIVVDPGFGFGKSVQQNFELIASVGELSTLNYPIVCAASRKSFIGAVTGQPAPADRVAGSVAITVMCYVSGVRLFRVHDVDAHRQALAVASASIDAQNAAESVLGGPGVQSM